MMNNRIKIILEDDNEILGNGQGHPLRRQYLPTKRYIEILNKYKDNNYIFTDGSFRKTKNTIISKIGIYFGDETINISNLAVVNP